MDSRVQYNDNYDRAIQADKAATRYKDVMWTKIQPGSSGVTFDTCGDAGEAPSVCAPTTHSLIR